MERKPYRVRVEVEFPSIEDYLTIQRELNDGRVPLGKFAGVAVVTFFNQMVAEYAATKQAAAKEIDSETNAGLVPDDVGSGDTGSDSANTLAQA